MPTSWRSTPPSATADYQSIIAKIKKFAGEGKKTAVVSTINGDSNVPFYKELGNQGLKATDVPVVAFSVGEEELRGVDTKPLVGHLAAWNYFMSIKSPANTEFVEEVERLRQGQGHRRPQGQAADQRPDGSHLHRHQMWKQAVEKAKSTDTDKVIAAMAGQTFKAPGGFTSTMDKEEPPPAQAGVHRRGQGRRPVQRGVEDPGPGRGRPLERLHPREQGQEERAREEVTDRGRGASLPDGGDAAPLATVGRWRAGCVARARPAPCVNPHRQETHLLHRILLSLLLAWPGWAAALDDAQALAIAVQGDGRRACRCPARTPGSRRPGAGAFPSRAAGRRQVRLQGGAGR
jgi:hypothetical protein